MTGTGTFLAFGGQAELRVEGTDRTSHITLELVPDGFQPFEFRGTITESGDILSGVLNGSGFEDVPIEFLRPE